MKQEAFVLISDNSHRSIQRRKDAKCTGDYTYTYLLIDLIRSRRRNSVKASLFWRVAVLVVLAKSTHEGLFWLPMSRLIVQVLS